MVSPVIGAKLENHHNWKGGRIVKHGYIMIKSPYHPYKNARGYVFEHRLVMEAHLGRYLDSNEEVDHKDKNRKNNNIENLQLFETKGQHTAYHNKIIDERHCLKCGSNKTYIHKKQGYPVWFKRSKGFLCQICRDVERYNPMRKGRKSKHNSNGVVV